MRTMLASLSLLFFFFTGCMERANDGIFDQSMAKDGLVRRAVFFEDTVWVDLYRTGTSEWLGESWLKISVDGFEKNRGFVDQKIEVRIFEKADNLAEQRKVYTFNIPARTIWTSKNIPLEFDEGKVRVEIRKNGHLTTQWFEF